MNEDNIVDIWMGLKEFMDKKAIETAASKYVDVLADNGVEDHVLKSALGSDEDLDTAIEYYLDGFEDETEDVDYDSHNWDEED